MTLITAYIDKGPLLSMVPRTMQHIITHIGSWSSKEDAKRTFIHRYYCFYNIYGLLSMGRMGELKKRLNTRLLWL